MAQLAPHLPADPEQKQAAGDEKARSEAKELGGGEREDDAQDRGGDDADEDRLGALILGQARRREPDDDGVVAGQHQVDHDDLAESAAAFPQ